MVASKHYYGYFSSRQVSVDTCTSGKPVDVLVRKQIVLLLIAHLVCGLSHKRTSILHGVNIRWPGAQDGTPLRALALGVSGGSHPSKTQVAGIPHLFKHQTCTYIKAKTRNERLAHFMCSVKM